MKKSISLAIVLSMLAACERQSDHVADPSAAQNAAAEQAYVNLREGQFEQFLAQLDPELQTYFKDNEKLMKKFSHSIPEGEYKSKTLMLKTFEQSNNKVAEFKVSYEIAYPKNLVQYDVSFDKPNGSSKIQNINIRVFGES